jgi:uncharacterized protein (TIGR02300 family)
VARKNEECMVATKDLGSKHLCASCGVKFYDLGKKPPTCPKCETVAEVVVKPRPTTRAAPKPARAPAAKKPEVVAEPKAETEAETSDEPDDAPPATGDDNLDADKDRKD